MPRMRLVAGAALAMSAVPVTAQISIGPNGVRAGNTVIDSTGVHTRTANVTGKGVSTSGGPTILTNGQTRSIDCRAKTLTLDGNDNRLTVSGCRAVVVNGNRNTIVAAFAQPGRIAVLGNNNRVRWHAVAPARVAVSNIGSGNVLQQR